MDPCHNGGVWSVTQMELGTVIAPNEVDASLVRLEVNVAQKRAQESADNWWECHFSLNSLQQSLPVFFDEVVHRRGYSPRWVVGLMAKQPAVIIGFTDKGTLEPDQPQTLLFSTRRPASPFLRKLIHPRRITLSPRVERFGARLLTPTSVANPWSWTENSLVNRATGRLLLERPRTGRSIQSLSPKYSGRADTSWGRERSGPVADRIGPPAQREYNVLDGVQLVLAIFYRAT